jgi:T-complex protein 1 subunit delta
MAAVPGSGDGRQSIEGNVRSRSEKDKSVRESNIIAARAVADCVRTSLGPRGLDKMITSSGKNTIVSNDGATIVKQLEVFHPCAKMLVDLAQAQDDEAGDGTTSVVVHAGALLGAVEKLLHRGIHPTIIADAFLTAASKSEEILQAVAIPIEMKDRETMLNAATTSLSSKVVSQYSQTLAPIAVDSVLHVIDPETATNVNLNDIRVVKRLGGTIEDTEMVNGLVFQQTASKSQGGPTRVPNAKIALIQFQLSPPKTNMESNVVISDYQQMDKLLKEERNYLLKICKKIKAAGCNVLLIQKSILRDAVTDLSLHFLAKLKVMVVKDIERDEVEFISKTLGCKPIADPELFTKDRLGSAEMVEEIQMGQQGSVVKITGIPTDFKTVSVIVRGSSRMVLDEAERSLHDALCVIRCLVKKKFVISGGGAPEINVSRGLQEYARSVSGLPAICIQAFAEALETVPYTLAENAGLKPIDVVTELRNQHAAGNKHAGINIRKGGVSDMTEINVVQPLVVSQSALRLAAETVAHILKIDDIVTVR